MAERESVTLRCPPPPPAELAGFPTDQMADILYRVVRAGRNPWWFSSSMAGRFDIEAPRGTCYLGSDDTHALVEVIGSELDAGLVSSEFIEARRIRVIPAPRRVELAACTSNRARSFGVTLEIGTMVPYDCPQQWATSFHDAGFGGVRYHLRHVPASGFGTALFEDSSTGPATAVEHGSGGFTRTDWDDGEERRITEGILRRLDADFGIRVAPRPRLRELTQARILPFTNGPG